VISRGRCDGPQVAKDGLTLIAALFVLNALGYFAGGSVEGHVAAIRGDRILGFSECYSYHAALVEEPDSLGTYVLLPSAGSGAQEHGVGCYRNQKLSESLGNVLTFAFQESLHRLKFRPQNLIDMRISSAGPLDPSRSG